MAKRIRGEGSIFFDEGKRLWTLMICLMARKSKNA